MSRFSEAIESPSILSFAPPTPRALVVAFFSGKSWNPSRFPRPFSPLIPQLHPSPLVPGILLSYPSPLPFSCLVIVIDFGRSMVFAAGTATLPVIQLFCRRACPNQLAHSSLPERTCALFCSSTTLTLFPCFIKRLPFSPLLRHCCNCRFSNSLHLNIVCLPIHVVVIYDSLLFLIEHRPTTLSLILAVPNPSLTSVSCHKYLGLDFLCPPGYLVGPTGFVASNLGPALVSSSNNHRPQYRPDSPFYLCDRCSSFGANHPQSAITRPTFLGPLITPLA